MMIFNKKKAMTSVVVLLVVAVTGTVPAFASGSAADQSFVLQAIHDPTPIIVEADSGTEQIASPMLSIDEIVAQSNQVDEPAHYRITFSDQHGNEYAWAQVDEGGFVVKPEYAPFLDGCAFDYWYDELDVERRPYDFSAPVFSNVNLRPRYINLSLSSNSENDILSNNAIVDTQSLFQENEVLGYLLVVGGNDGDLNATVESISESILQIGQQPDDAPTGTQPSQVDEGDTDQKIADSLLADILKLPNETTSLVPSDLVGEELSLTQINEQGKKENAEETLDSEGTSFVSIPNNKPEDAEESASLTQQVISDGASDQNVLIVDADAILTKLLDELNKSVEEEFYSDEQEHNAEVLNENSHESPLADEHDEPDSLTTDNAEPSDTVELPGMDENILDDDSISQNDDGIKEINSEGHDNGLIKEELGVISGDFTSEQSDNVIGEEDMPGDPLYTTAEEINTETMSAPAISISYAFEGSEIILGTEITLKASVQGIPAGASYSIQWQNNASGAFRDIENATGTSYTFCADNQNTGCVWQAVLVY